MKDKNWTDIVSKQGDLRHFASMAIRNPENQSTLLLRRLIFCSGSRFGRTSDPKTDYQRYGHQ